MTTINTNHVSTTQSDVNGDEFSSRNAALGVGQVLSARNEMLLARNISSRASSLRAALPRIGGAFISLAVLGADLYQTFKSDMNKNDNSFTESRKQFVKSMTSISAGFGVGTVAGAAASVAVVMGAPAVVGTGITVLGVGGAILAAKMAYDWASKNVDSWIK